jgi:hypothetical protein
MCSTRDPKCVRLTRLFPCSRAASSSSRLVYGWSFLYLLETPWTLVGVGTRNPLRPILHREHSLLGHYRYDLSLKIY